MLLVLPSEADRRALESIPVRPTTPKDYSGVVVKKPWGHEQQIFANHHFSIWRLDLYANSETSMHCHRNKTTTIMVGDGSIVFSTLTEAHILAKGDGAIVHPGVFHRSATIQGAILFETESPADKDDLVRLRDKYGREGQGYEQCA